MYTHIILLLDRSGSMSSIKNDMEGGIKEFINKQKLEEGKCTMTFAQFSHDYQTMFSFRDLTEINDITIEPMGSTALIDSMCRLIQESGKELSKIPEALRPDKVLFLTITDGEENASTRYNASQLKEMIEHQESKYNWSFSYIGANQDSFANSHTYGVASSQTMNFNSTSRGITTAFASLSDATSTYRKSSLTTSFTLTPEQQKASEESK